MRSSWVAWRRGLGEARGIMRDALPHALRAILVTSLAAFLLTGCGTSGATSTPIEAPPATSLGANPGEPPSTPGGPALPQPLIAALPRGTTPTPTRIVVVSDASEPLSIETTFGRLESVTIASLEAPLGLLTADSVDEPGGYPRACACPCGEACAECERPQDRSEPLVVGGRVELAWDGLLRRFRSDTRGTCFDTFAPSPGRYLVRVCTGRPIEGDIGPCGSAEVTLPSSEPITVHVGARETLACPLTPALLDRAARAALSSMATRHVVPDRAARCEPVATCYAETDLPYGEDVVRGARYARDPSSPPPSGCGVLVAPRGDRLLVRVLLPLPEGWLGGERFDHELDGAATRVLSMRFEQ